MIVDTGILYALADRRDAHHASACQVFDSDELKVVPEPVIVETDWMILERLGVDVEMRFLASLGEGAFNIESPGQADRRRALELVKTYRALKIGYVDAVTVAMAERLNEIVVATVSRRLFGTIRPRHVTQFVLIP